MYTEEELKEQLWKPQNNKHYNKTHVCHDIGLKGVVVVGLCNCFFNYTSKNKNSANQASCQFWGGLWDCSDIVSIIVLTYFNFLHIIIYMLCNKPF